MPNVGTWNLLMPPVVFCSCHLSSPHASQIRIKHLTASPTCFLLRCLGTQDDAEARRSLVCGCVESFASSVGQLNGVFLVLPCLVFRHSLCHGLCAGGARKVGAEVQSCVTVRSHHDLMASLLSPSPPSSPPNMKNGFSSPECGVEMRVLGF